MERSKDLFSLIQEELPDTVISFSTDYNHCIDFRMMSNKSHKDNFNSKKYVQVFSKSNGFKSNLSILDLIFNLGPETNDFLE